MQYKHDITTPTRLLQEIEGRPIFLISCDLATRPDQEVGCIRDYIEVSAPAWPAVNITVHTPSVISVVATGQTMV